MRIANRAKVSEIFNMAWIRNSAVAWLQDEKKTTTASQNLAVGA
jgi:hypothetical protein